jgi:hypothetical protein
MKLATAFGGSGTNIICLTTKHVGFNSPRWDPGAFGRFS